MYRPALGRAHVAGSGLLETFVPHTGTQGQQQPPFLGRTTVGQQAKRMASAVLGRALAFGVGLGVGSLGAYKFILDELRNSTKTILAANGALEKRLAAVERAA